MSHNPLTYIDIRSSSIYTIYLDDSGDFSYAVRYLGDLAGTGTTYEELEDVPQPHRNEIEKLMLKEQV